MDDWHNGESDSGANVVVERPQAGRPHEGKVLAAIQAHADDIPLFCAGTIAKLLEEGYTGYLIQTTNDEKCGPTPVWERRSSATRERWTPWGGR